jgi:hypothetical protein
MILRRSAQLAIALTLCAGLIAAVPAVSLSSGGATVAKKKKCKKGTTLKKRKCVPKKKKKAAKPKATGVPADGNYAGTGISITLATRSGKRVVGVRASVPLTCTQTPTQSTQITVVSMPLIGTGFTGPSDAPPEFGKTTMTGTFVSATRVHLTSQTVDYQNGPGNTCSGSLDVTTTIHLGY